MALSVALEIHEYAVARNQKATALLPETWRISDHFAKGAGFDTRLNDEGKFVLGTGEIIFPDSLITLLVYAPYDLYKSNVNNELTFIRTQKNIKKFPWYPFENSEHIAGNDRELTIEWWDKLFRNSLTNHHVFEKDHPFAAFGKSKKYWKGLLNTRYFTSGDFYYDSVVGYRENPAEKRVERMLRDTNGGIMLRALSKLNGLSTLGLLANVNVRTAVTFILMTNRLWHLRGDGSENWSWVFPANMHAPFTINAQHRLFDLGAGQTVTWETAFWQGLCGDWKSDFVALFVTERLRPLFEAHASDIGAHLNKVFADADKIFPIWSAVLKQRGATVHDANVKLTTELLLRELDVNEKDLTDAFAAGDGEVVFVCRDGRENVIWKFNEPNKNTLNDFWDFVNNSVVHGDRFDVVTTGLSLVPWNTLVLLPKLHRYDSWNMSPSACAVLLVTWLLSPQVASSEEQGDERVTDPAFVVETADAIRSYAMSTYQRMQNWPPEDGSYSDAQKIASGSGLKVESVDYPRNHNEDGVMTIAGKQIHVSGFLFLCMSEMEPPDELIDDKKTWQLFRSRLLHAIGHSSGEVPWDLNAMNKSVYCFSNNPYVFTTTEHPLTMHGLRNVPNPTYAKVGKWNSEYMLHAYLLRHGMHSNWVDRTVFTEMRLRGERYKSNGHISFAIMSGQAPYFLLSKAMITFVQVGSYVPDKPVNSQFLSLVYTDDKYKLFDLDENGMAFSTANPGDKVCPGRLFHTVRRLADFPKPLPHFSQSDTFRSTFNDWLSVVFGGEHEGIQETLAELYRVLPRDFNTDVRLSPEVLETLGDQPRCGPLIKRWTEAIMEHLEEHRGFECPITIDRAFLQDSPNAGSKPWVVPSSGQPWNDFVRTVLNDNSLNFLYFDFNKMMPPAKVLLAPLMDPTYSWPSFRFRPLELMALVGKTLLQDTSRVSRRDSAKVIWKLALRSLDVNSDDLSAARNNIVYSAEEDTSVVTYGDRLGELFVNSTPVRGRLPFAWTDAFLVNALVNRNKAISDTYFGLDEKYFNGALSVMRNEKWLAEKFNKIDKFLLRKFNKAVDFTSAYLDTSLAEREYALGLNLEKFLTRFKKMLFYLSEDEPVTVELSTKNYSFVPSATVVLGKNTRFTLINPPGNKAFALYACRYVIGVVLDVLLRESTQITIQRPPHISHDVLTPEESEKLKRPLALPLIVDVTKDIFKKLKDKDRTEIKERGAEKMLRFAVALDRLYTDPTDVEAKREFLKLRLQWPVRVLTAHRIPYLELDSGGIVLDEERVSRSLRRLFFDFLRGEFEDLTFQNDSIQPYTYSESPLRDEPYSESPLRDEPYTEPYDSRPSNNDVDDESDEEMERDDEDTFTEDRRSLMDGLTEELKRDGALQTFLDKTIEVHMVLMNHDLFGRHGTLRSDEELQASAFLKDVGDDVFHYLQMAEYPLLVGDMTLERKPVALVDALREVEYDDKIMRLEALGVQYDYVKSEVEVLLDLGAAVKKKREHDRSTRSKSPVENEIVFEHTDQMLTELHHTLFLFLCTMYYTEQVKTAYSASLVKTANDVSLCRELVQVLQAKYGPFAGLKSELTAGRIPKLKHFTTGETLAHTSRNFPWTNLISYITHPHDWMKWAGFPPQLIEDTKNASNCMAAWSDVVSSPQWKYVVHASHYSKWEGLEFPKDEHTLRMLDYEGWHAVKNRLNKSDGKRWGYWNPADWQPEQFSTTPLELLTHYFAVAPSVPKLASVVNGLSNKCNPPQIMIKNANTRWYVLRWHALWYDLRQTAMENDTSKREREGEEVMVVEETEKKEEPEKPPKRKKKKKNNKRNDTNNTIMMTVGGVAIASLAAAAIANHISKRRRMNPTERLYMRQFNAR